MLEYHQHINFLRNKHAIRDAESMFKHLFECELFTEPCSYYALVLVYNDSNGGISMKLHI